jgi:hypothetical protein
VFDYSRNALPVNSLAGEAGEKKEVFSIKTPKKVRVERFRFKIWPQWTSTNWFNQGLIFHQRSSALINAKLVMLKKGFQILVP